MQIFIHIFSADKKVCTKSDILFKHLSAKKLTGTPPTYIHNGEIVSKLPNGVNIGGMGWPHTGFHRFINRFGMVDRIVDIDASSLDEFNSSTWGDLYPKDSIHLALATGFMSEEFDQMFTIQQKKTLHQMIVQLCDEYEITNITGVDTSNTSCIKTVIDGFIKKIGIHIL